MIRKILYGVGGVIGLFILIGIFAPSPEPTPIQQAPAVVQQQPTTEVEASEPVATTSEPEHKPADTVQPVVEQPKQTPSAPVQTQPQFQYYAVTDVVDGDTLKINMGGTIETLRLIGIDTPETVDPRKPVQCFGREASNKAKELLIGTKVRLEKDPTQGELDKYGRTLAYVYREDGLFYNKYMIEQGYAHEYTYNTPYKYQAEFKTAQKSAQENLRGLWSPTTCNGDTTSSPITSPQTTTSSGKFYTSSHYSAKYYYPESCDGWQGLSTSYLKSFDSVEALLAAYPSRTLHEPCK